MPRVTPAARLRLLDAIASLQRLRHEMSRLSQADEDYENKKRALEKVIKELQSASDDEVQAIRSTHAVTQSSQSDRS